MGFMDSIRSVLGISAEADATRDADPEDLFGMSTAYLTMEADLGFESVGAAALCFSSVDSTDFEQTVEEVETILQAGEEETGTTFRVKEDSHGWEWVVTARGARGSGWRTRASSWTSRTAASASFGRADGQ